MMLQSDRQSETAEGDISIERNHSPFHMSWPIRPMITPCLSSHTPQIPRRRKVSTSPPFHLTQQHNPSTHTHTHTTHFVLCRSVVPFTPPLHRSSNTTRQHFEKATLHVPSGFSFISTTHFKTTKQPSPQLSLLFSFSFCSPLRVLSPVLNTLSRNSLRHAHTFTACQLYIPFTCFSLPFVC